MILQNFLTIRPRGEGNPRSQENYDRSHETFGGVFPFLFARQTNFFSCVIEMLLFCEATGVANWVLREGPIFYVSFSPVSTVVCFCLFACQFVSILVSFAVSYFLRFVFYCDLDVSVMYFRIRAIDILLNFEPQQLQPTCLFFTCITRCRGRTI